MLRFDNPEHPSSVSKLVMEHMRGAGFYIRMRPGKPELWRVTPDRSGPIRMEALQDWITEHFQCYDESRSAFVKAPWQLASWIITIELGDRAAASSSGIPPRPDDMVPPSCGLGSMPTACARQAAGQWAQERRSGRAHEPFNNNGRFVLADVLSYTRRV